MESRGTEFSRARRLSASVGLRREGSKSAITSHENCCRAERSAHGSLVQNIFVRSIDQPMATTHASICRCLDFVHCTGRMREGEATSPRLPAAFTSRGDRWQARGSSWPLKTKNNGSPAARASAQPVRDPSRAVTGTAIGLRRCALADRSTSGWRRAVGRSGRVALQGDAGLFL